MEEEDLINNYFRDLGYENAKDFWQKRKINNTIEKFKKCSKGELRLLLGISMGLFSHLREEFGDISKGYKNLK